MVRTGGLPHAVGRPPRNNHRRVGAELPGDRRLAPRDVRGRQPSRDLNAYFGDTFDQEF